MAPRGLALGPDDPLFPATKTEVRDSGHYENRGLDRKHWKSASATRQIFVTSLSGPVFHISTLTVRKTLALMV